MGSTILMEGLLGNSLNGKEIPSERPAELPNHDWDAVRRIQAGIQRLRGAEDAGRTNAQKASELKALESEVEAKREKVERQLRLIHDVLTDPSAIDRVEEYDGTFAKGNLENLARLARAVSQPQGSGTRKRRKEGEESG